MNSFYLATAKITCPIDPFFTGCWNAENTLFPIGFSYRQHSSNNPLPILKEEIQKSTTGQTSTFMVGSTSISRLIWGLSVLLSFSPNGTKYSVDFQQAWGKKPALMFALGHMKDIGMFYSALPRSIIPWLGGIQDEDKKWAEPRFLRTTLHVLGP